MQKMKLEKNWLWKEKPGNKHPLAFRSHKNNKYSIPELAEASASLMLLARWHGWGVGSWLRGKPDGLQHHLHIFYTQMWVSFGVLDAL